MGYSPLGATYGIRIDKFLESIEDFDKYHRKLNVKLQKLKRRLHLVTKDTKRYSSKEKCSTINKESYKLNKLHGMLVLLQSERNLAYTEILILKARQRGKMKKSEKKLVTSRLKRVCQNNCKLLDITSDEPDVSIKYELLVFDKLCRVEYLTLRKQSGVKHSDLICKELSLSFEALFYLQTRGKISSSIIEYVKSRYEYLLKYHSQIFSNQELRHFIIKQVEKYQNEDDLLKLMLQTGYCIPVQDFNIKDSTLPLTIQWRSFTAKIGSNKVAELLYEINNTEVNNLSSYSNKLLKWERVLKAQNHFIKTKHTNNNLEYEEGEDDYIILTYINYNSCFTTIERDTIVFRELFEQWMNSSKKSLSYKLMKFKEIERIIKNLTMYLQNIMELPGVYSDDELLNQLQLAKTYYELYSLSGCLASFYQSQGKYLESLALYVDSLQKLTKAENQVDTNQLLLPRSVLTKEDLIKLRKLIESGWNNVILLAEYNKTFPSVSKYELSVIEKVDRKIKCTNISLENLFPVRPRLIPIPAKPTLFDLAFNYIEYDKTHKSLLIEIEHERHAIEQVTSDTPKKRGIFGLFNR